MIQARATAAEAEAEAEAAALAPQQVFGRAYEEFSAKLYNVFLS
jgi:hypothetical protein